MNGIGFLFDLDGVLIDSETEYTRIWNEIENKFPTGKKDFALSIKGQTLNKILNDNYPEEIRKEVSKLLHDLEHDMQYCFCQGAEQFLKDLNDGNHKIAVVTSSDETKMNHLYADIPNFKNYVDIIVDSSKVTKSKPHPEGYLLGAELLGVNPKKCVVFEDSLQGVRAGKEAGAYVLGIIGKKTREELLPFSDCVVENLEEINLDNLISILQKR